MAEQIKSPQMFYPLRSIFIPIIIDTNYSGFSIYYG